MQWVEPLKFSSSVMLFWQHTYRMLIKRQGFVGFRSTLCLICSAFAVSLPIRNNHHTRVRRVSLYWVLQVSIPGDSVSTRTPYSATSHHSICLHSSFWNLPAGFCLRELFTLQMYSWSNWLYVARNGYMTYTAENLWPVIPGSNHHRDLRTSFCCRSTAATIQQKCRALAI